MSMKITNKVHKIMPMQQGTSQRTGELWQSQDLILITDERYPKEQAFSFKDANCKKLDNLLPGDLVEVTCEIDSHEVNGRYFTTLFAWEVTVLNAVPRPTTQQTAAPAATETPSAADGNVIHPK